ncbi:Re/Si-specific NAD(P)(+) transhydrogenase subunit alpha [Burkholderia multivorans]|uniref:Re/Si-specific NAD(P)(+) transhydrogenase subunit alpha n=1 Tax=Burkholderia multivorans TaxID=87883 RepID=UPI0021C0292B|nr:Re/Si-specific NAD(P)(+) transhydrogenase subunit alpha [Burkholderia multivorans]MDR8762376.1 NAD(P) transhydrogenase subunit alpha part 1 [Burkholderia multivorans]MDR8766186.1 NAD(P) transhydrogenase subunit alpha part 1 [Burkholderia multivorans]MDR8770028.1 NAD(P) transhydrogenase subunit alpha part 1 [Burkholderia multivorans]MDR8789745.1 NAD(P) transhydrogenase subunit alpha part 1 [Burkholderia multivorans]MDR8794581.1 NAD(P) transhydrogenase subunit alpha part 1 [Burkholderia multi
MKIGIPAELGTNEARVAATPETVKKYISAGYEVMVERGAGVKASFPDLAFETAGAILADKEAVFDAEVILKVQSPTDYELTLLKPGCTLIGMLEPFDGEKIGRLALSGVTGFALEAAPRTTRAQSIDVLSSQANIAGYRAVLVAASLYPRFVPMLMTAAGTVKAARVLILGAGVAGLQAIATAKRLGAVIEASDVRPAVKEQVESLGARFLDVPYETDEEREAAQGVGGYARPMPPSWLMRQATLVHERAKQADIVISTALIPGRLAPTLIAVETVEAMKAGAVLVDLAAGRGAEYAGRKGGNCPLTEPDTVVTHCGVVIAGYTNLASQVPADASSLYARNVADFLRLIVTKEGRLEIDMSDDIVAATLVCRDGVPAGK